MLALGVFLLNSATAWAVPFDDRPKLLLHVRPVTTKNLCTWGNLNDCQQAVTRGQTDPTGNLPYYVYLLAATGPYRSVTLGGNDIGLAGLQLGLNYDGGANSGVDIFGWTLCATLQFAAGGWPSPGSSNLITWDSFTVCQKGEVGIAGYFYVAAYSPDVLGIVPRPIDNLAKVAACTNAEVDLNLGDLGSVRFTTAGTTDGCNPCIQSCSGAPPPNLSCSVSRFPPSGDAPLTVSFVGSASGGTPPYVYSWSFGDGSTSTAATTGHVYQNPGTYQATFSVSDSGTPVRTCTAPGLFTTATTPPPPPVEFFTVLQPNGGETWLAGSPVDVAWNGPAAADIAISYDAGATWTPLLANVGGNGSNQIELLAPWVSTPAARIRVSRAGQAVVIANSDLSDGLFRIVMSATPPPAAVRLEETLRGVSPSAWLGYSVAAVGDFNGDGFADCAVGAPLDAAAGEEAGRVFVRFGGPAGDRPPLLVLDGQPGDRFGWSLASAGNVNGDSYDDLIVGAPAANTDAGRAYVFFGGPSPDGTADLVLAHSGAGDGFGHAVASAGDLDGDGLDDLAVGAPFRDAGAANSGSCFLYLGGSTPDSGADLVLDGVEANAGFGLALGSARDLNRDGYADLVVAAPLSSVDGPNAGQAYLYLGAASLDSGVDLTLHGLEPQGEFGRALAALADWNGDGFPDLVVGAPAKDNGASEGKVFVFQGGRVPDAAPDLILAGSRPIDGFGAAVGGSHFNGDDFSDLLVGAPYNDAGGAEAGRVYLYYGGLFPDDVADHLLTGPAPGDQFGRAAAAAGDTHGDDFADVLTGAPFDDVSGEDAGAGYLHDLNRYHLLAPPPGATWNVGANQTISWLGQAPADLLLSVDGGRGFDLLASRVGGQATNSLPIRVPHSPTRFARIQVRPSDTGLHGSDTSDSLFTIRSSVALLAFKSEPLELGTRLTWSTEPGVGPDGLAGYRLYRGRGGVLAGETPIGPELIRESSFTDAEGRPGDAYRLDAVNGLGETLELGRLTILPEVFGLRISPTPARIGRPIQFLLTAPGVSADILGRDLDVGVFDLRGRRVATLDPKEATAGASSLVFHWDGRSEEGRPLASGVYFVRAHGAGPVVRINAQQRLVMVR